MKVLDIEFQLLNDSFADNFDINSIQISINSKSSIQQQRYFQDQIRKTLYIKLQISEGFRDLQVTIQIKRDDVKTQINRKLQQDYTKVIHLGIQLPQMLKLNMGSSINWMQQSTFMSILRLFPVFLIFFGQIQGILVLLIADIYLPQRFYEVLRFFSCFIFKNVKEWPLSEEQPNSMTQKDIFGNYIPNTDQDMHISRLGIHENIFVQVFYYFIVLIIFWIMVIIFRIKLMDRAKYLMLNILSTYHKTTLFLLLIVILNQIRLLSFVNSNLSIISLTLCISFLIYISILILKLFKLAFQQNDDYENDEQIEHNIYFNIRNIMRFYFLNCKAQINTSYNHNSKLKTLFINYYPLFSLIFKIYIALILVFMQTSGLSQIIVLFVSYILYFLFTLRFFLVNLRLTKFLKVSSQSVFILLILFSIVNHFLLSDIINELPQDESSSITDSQLNPVNAVEILQFILMIIYFMIELIIKIPQMQNLISQIKDKQFYDSTNRVYIPQKQIQEISNAFVEMLNVQKFDFSNNHESKSRNQSIFQTKLAKEKQDLQMGHQHQFKSSIMIHAFKQNNQNNAENSENNDSSKKKNISIFQYSNMHQYTPSNRNKDTTFVTEFQKSPQSQQSPSIQPIISTKLKQYQQKEDQHDEIDETKSQKVQNKSNQVLDFLNIPKQVQPILQSSKNTDQQNQSQQQNTGDVFTQNMSEYICDSSEVDDFSTFKQALSIKDSIKMDEQKISLGIQLTEQMHDLMKSKQNVLSINPPLQQNALDLLDPLNQNQDFRQAKNQYSILASSELIEKVKNKYDMNSFEFINQTKFLKDATVLAHRTSQGYIKKIDTVYSQKNFSIINHNKDKYEYLVDLFEKKRGDKLQFITRIFFDIDTYPYNSHIRINSHLSYTYCFVLNG